MANSIRITSAGNYYANSFDEISFNQNNSGVSKNILPFSNDFNNAFSWQIGSVTISNNQAIAPDGSYTAALLTATDKYPRITYFNYVQNNYAVKPGEIYTYSIFVKYVNYQYCVLLNESFSGPPNNNASVQFDLIVGFVNGLSGAATAAGIIPYPNGWWRIWVTTTVPSTYISSSNYYQPQFRLGHYDGTNYSGSQVYVWGAQMEFNSSPTAGPSVYVPTGFPKNLIASSENFNAWYYDNSTLSANNVLDPNGNPNGSLVTSTLTGGSNQVFVQQQIPNLSANTNYTYSIYLKQGTSPTTVMDFYIVSPYIETRGLITWGTTPSIQFATYLATLISSSFTPVGNGWYRVSMSMNIGSATAVVCRVYVTTQGTTNVSGYNVNIWGGQLETGITPTPYIKNSGIYYNVLPASNSVSKVDNTGSNYIAGQYDEITYNPSSGVIKNLFFNSQTLSNTSVWLTTAATLTANATLAPDGTQTAYRLTESATGPTNHDFDYSVGIQKIALNNPYTISVYAKAGQRTSFQIVLQSWTTYDKYYAYNFDLNAVTSTFAFSTAGSTVLGSSITPVGNGWYRCSINGITLNSLNTTVAGIFHMINGGTPSYTGDGTSGMYFWGPQLELGNTATIYESTGSNAVPAPTFIQKTTNTGDTYVPGIYDEVTGVLPVTNGLILNLDPGKLESYTGTGVTIIDTTNNANGTISSYSAGIGQLGNSSFNTDNGGIIKLSGAVSYTSGEYINVGNWNGNTAFFSPNSAFTISSWVRFDGYPIGANNVYAPTGQNYGCGGTIVGTLYYGQYGIGWYGFTGSFNSGGVSTQVRGYLNGVQFVNSTNSYVPTPNVWYNFVQTYSPSNQGNFHNFYVNGTLYSATSGSLGTYGQYAVTVPFTIGGNNIEGGNATIVSLLGSVGQTLAYNRALSATEVLQNYNAFVGRYTAL
jgi:hypothetical protein